MFLYSPIPSISVFFYYISPIFYHRSSSHSLFSPVLIDCIDFFWSSGDALFFKALKTRHLNDALFKFCRKCVTICYAFSFITEKRGPIVIDNHLFENGRETAVVDVKAVGNRPACLLADCANIKKGCG